MSNQVCGYEWCENEIPSWEYEYCPEHIGYGIKEYTLRVQRAIESLIDAVNARHAETQKSLRALDSTLGDIYREMPRD